MFSSNDICENFVKNTYWSPKITPPKNAFLAVCVYLDETIDLHEVNSRVPFGGNVGAGDSLLHKYLKCSKILRLHAIFQDAHGYMRSNKNIAPGCVYTLTTEKFLKNSMLLGHFLGFFIGRWWSFSIPNTSIFFLSSHLKSSDVNNSRVSSAQATRFKKPISPCHQQRGIDSF